MSLALFLQTVQNVFFLNWLLEVADSGKELLGRFEEDAAEPQIPEDIDR
ncbi:hypothetical protein [Coleofasciculus sp. FACHB-501]|nr:hypothetical protein [Coleofasciculus sp. FACHB-501]MBD1838865.1 hypothetical protein [Coleofasciculus sp. FACHB-501]